MINEILEIYVICHQDLGAPHHSEKRYIPSNANDVRGLDLLPFNLLENSEIYGNNAFNDYQIEDELAELEGIKLKVIRKNKSKRKYETWKNYLKQSTRHFIETVFIQITRRFLKFIHAVTFEDFLLKISSFIFVFTLEHSFL